MVVDREDNVRRHHEVYKAVAEVLAAVEDGMTNDNAVPAIGGYR